MNQKELNELRRRLAPGKNAIRKLYGCFVNTKGEIITTIEQPLIDRPEDELDSFFGLLKKVLSGGLGRCMLEVPFSHEQLESEDYRLLLDAKEDSFKDDSFPQQLYQRIIENVNLDTNYLILLAADAYDVPQKSKNEELVADGGETIFRYILCSICPVKDGKRVLSFYQSENSFRQQELDQIVQPPQLGFLFPMFEDRMANVSSALYYSKDTADLHDELVQGFFHTKPPMPPQEQNENFRALLCESLEQEVDFDLVQAVHEGIRTRIEEHKESRTPETLALSPIEVGTILKHSGASEEKVAVFQEKCKEYFGEYASLDPNNIVNAKKFELQTPQVKITVDPAFSYEVETRIIDGRRYILIPAEQGVEVNGINVTIEQDQTSPEEDI